MVIRLLPLALLLLAACQPGGQSPTEGSGPVVEVVTSRGVLIVNLNGQTFDAARAAAAIEAGYQRALSRTRYEERRAHIERIPVQPLLVVVRPESWLRECSCTGKYDDETDTAQTLVNVEHVLTHELQHRFCHLLGHDDECCRWVDHGESPRGVDLDCRPLGRVGASAEPRPAPVCVPVGHPWCAGMERGRRT